MRESDFARFRESSPEMSTSAIRELRYSTTADPSPLPTSSFTLCWKFASRPLKSVASASVGRACPLRMLRSSCMICMFWFCPFVASTIRSTKEERDCTDLCVGANASPLLANIVYAFCNCSKVASDFVLCFCKR